MLCSGRLRGVSADNLDPVKNWLRFVRTSLFYSCPFRNGLTREEFISRFLDSCVLFPPLQDFGSANLWPVFPQPIKTSTFYLSWILQCYSLENVFRERVGVNVELTSMFLPFNDYSHWIHICCVIYFTGYALLFLEVGWSDMSHTIMAGIVSQFTM